jgi:glycosyltransferase involved in cell wall biosynthesis
MTDKSQYSSPSLREDGSEPCYVLLTAAHNEQLFIAQTIESVLSQTMAPVKWVIASDGSNDRTDEIVRNYSSRHDFIQLLRVERTQARGVGSKVNALNLANKQLQGMEYEFVGNLDADVTFQPGYFETLLARFQNEPKLGITGGMIYEKRGGKFKSRISNSVTSVAHAAQLVRRECYQAIGGYSALEYGGEDWYAEVSARMRGWLVEATPSLQVMHHRLTGGADRAMRHCFREGKMDFSVGSHPVFEVLKCARRFAERPLFFGGLARFAGFCSSHITRDARLVSPEFVSFLRSEQKQRLRSLFGRPSVSARGFGRGQSSDPCC